MHRAFTLIELLIVIAIIAILSLVVILVLNPTQLLQQARDSNRISDMSTLNTALGVYQAQGGSSMGLANIVYVSIPDPSATSTAGDQCQGLNLISLPAIYTYHCAATSTYRAVDGTGWIPVNFTTVSSGAPIGQLPTDPINTSSTREYYTYETNGTQYEITMIPESQKYGLAGSNDVISNDGGRLASVYEKGTTFGLEPLDYGDASLIGLWTFNEGVNAVAYDYSGSNATGSWNGTAIGNNSTYYTTGKIGPYAGDFDGSSDYVQAPTIPAMGSNFTITAWLKTNSASSQDIVTLNRTVHTNEFVFLMNANGTLTFWDYSGGYGFAIANTSVGTINNNGWHMIAFTRAGTAGRYYIDGVADAAPTAAQNNAYTYSNFDISHVGDSDGVWNGAMDDVRVYDRTLSATQIAAMYAAAK